MGAIVFFLLSGEREQVGHLVRSPDGCRAVKPEGQGFCQVDSSVKRARSYIRPECERALGSKKPGDGGNVKWQGRFETCRPCDMPSECQ